MPFEVYGADISQPEDRDLYLEVFAYMRAREVDMPEDLDLGYELLPPWIESNPEEAKEFLVFCSEHEDPVVRRAAAVATVDFLKDDPEFTLTTIERLLTDRDPTVRSASNYYHDILGGENILDDFLNLTGVRGVSRLIKAVKAAEEMDQASTEA